MCSFCVKKFINLLLKHVRIFLKNYSNLSTKTDNQIIIGKIERQNRHADRFHSLLVIEGTASELISTGARIVSPISHDTSRFIAAKFETVAWEIALNTCG